jgi:hypothetical protein
MIEGFNKEIKRAERRAENGLIGTETLAIGTDLEVGRLDFFP